jgi:phosphate transport system permease protein
MVPAVRALEVGMPAPLRQLPFFTGPPLGVGMLSAGLILAIMVIPFTSSIAREVLKSVPAAQREGAYALGATRFEAIRAALFYARTGIIGAVMLGFGRALGETIAIALIVSLVFKANPHILEQGAGAIAPLIAIRFSEASSLERSALIAAGLALFLLTLAVSLIARRIVARSASVK